MGKQTFKYILLCMGLYLALATFEIFLLRFAIELITQKFVAILIIYNVLLLIVNPIVVKIIIKKKFNFVSEDIIEEKIN